MVGSCRCRVVGGSEPAVETGLVGGGLPAGRGAGGSRSPERSSNSGSYTAGPDFRVALKTEIKERLGGHYSIFLLKIGFSFLKAPWFL